MINPSSTPLRRLSHAMAFAAFLLICGTSLAQVTWPTLPPGFRAATNDVSIWSRQTLPDWAAKALLEDDAALLDQSFRALPADPTNDSLVQRIFFDSLSTPSTKVAEWCLVNGASLGLHTVFTDRRSVSILPLKATIWRTNVPMARLLIAAGADPASPRGTSLSVAEDFLFTEFLPYFGTFRAESAKKSGMKSRWAAPKEPPPPARLELSGLMIAAGFDPFATNRTGVLIDAAIGNKLGFLTDILLTNQPVSVLRSKRGDVSLKLALEHGRTNAVNFLRSIPVPEK